MNLYEIHGGVKPSAIIRSPQVGYIHAAPHSINCYAVKMQIVSGGQAGCHRNQPDGGLVP